MAQRARNSQATQSCEQLAILDSDQFEFFARFMFNHTGVNLEENKLSMIQARLAKRLSRTGSSDFSSYIALLKSDKSEEIECINALTTHKTEFFREPAHFDFLNSTVLPTVLKNPTRLRIWSAASSTGEEIYSIVMTVLQFVASKPRLAGLDAKFLGTDIDTNVLAKAAKGIYSKSLLAPVPPPLLKAFFLEGTGANAEYYRIKPEIAQLVKFRRHNLLESFSAGTNLKFHIIFLRNVLIYFTEETRMHAIDKMTESLAPGGYLFVGHSESLTGLDRNLKRVGSAVYQKVK